MQCKAADDVRQKAYVDLRSLRQKLYDKNKYFYKYKNDSKAAYDLASNGDKDEIQSHCINQVERVMESWNNIDDFRQEYVRCNIRSTLRRLRTLDGRSLGPDEEPPVIPYVAEQAAKKQNIRSISILEEDNTVAPVKKTEKKHDESPRNLRDQTKPAAKSEKPAKPAHSVNSFATISQSNENEEAPQQDENKPTNEEAELMRKAEELRKEEEAAKFREHESFVIQERETRSSEKEGEAEDSGRTKFCERGRIWTML